MAKYNSDNTSNTNNQPSPKVKSIEELLSAKRTRNQQGVNKSTEATERATDLVRQNIGKATRAKLQTELINRTNLAVEEGVEIGIKEFLNQDIPAVLQTLNSQIGSDYQQAISSNENKLLEGQVVDAEWEEVDLDNYSLDFSSNTSTNYLLGSSQSLLTSSNTDVLNKEEEEDDGLDFKF